MGISGLLPLLKSIHKPCNLKTFAGQTIGVDAYGWLHRGTVACAIDLALGKPTTKFVDFSMHRVRMLIHFGVIPYLVFDGDYLPSKAATEKERAKRREESKKVGLELYRLGKVSQAHLELQKAVDVTPEMARQLIEELKRLGVQYIVAPYEADAQLAYLENQGIIHGILSEDSDLLVFGAKCLLTKLDQYGDCIEISRSDFTACREISLVGWTDAEFRRMAILSGCDYLASINKMGLKTAYRLVRKYKTIEKILRMLQFDGQYLVPAGYLEAFQRAELTFLHQRVFCPTANDIIMMNQLPAGFSTENLAFLGSEVDKEIALGTVRGDLHPTTKQPIAVKGNVSQSPRTPWINTRRQTVGTPSDLKSNKSIDTFFKAKRTPLAELDPNCFTPSPSQQRLLHQNSGSWTSSPAPIRPSLPRSAVSALSSEPPSAAARAAARAVLSASISASHPPKKRRLCSDLADAETASPTTIPAIERSRFFTSSTSIPSPSLQSNKRHRKPKKADFNIWSDDSVEDAMINLPDISQTEKPSGTGGIPVYKDKLESVEGQATDLCECHNAAQTESRDSTTSRSTMHSEISVCTSVTSITDAAESQSLAKTLDTHVQSELAALKKDYLHQPEPERCRAQRQEIIKSTGQTGNRPPLQRKGSMTPLQRLGATALNRSYSCNSSLNRKMAVAQEQDSKSQPPVLTNVLRSPSLPPVRPAREVSGVKGSEDAMIPDSEAEESEGILSDDGREKPKMDLGRFAFTG
ncbi:MAG: hypothetical protein Q9201_002770 [Fulgogasparrea decipioides]